MLLWTVGVRGKKLITKKFVVMMGTEFPWMLLMVAHILQIE